MLTIPSPRKFAAKTTFCELATRSDPRRRRPAGFSLLEVILALAILTGSIAVLGEAVRMGTVNGQVARDLSQAQLLCESKMAEITSGFTPAMPIYNAEFDPIDVSTGTGTAAASGEAAWLYSIETENLDAEGMIAVSVTVTQIVDPPQKPVELKLLRWMLGSATDVGEELGAEGGGGF